MFATLTTAEFYGPETVELPVTDDRNRAPRFGGSRYVARRVFMSGAKSQRPLLFTRSIIRRAGLTLEAHEPPSLHWCQPGSLDGEIK